MDEIRAFELLKKLAFTRMSGTEEEYTAAKMLAAEAESIGVNCEIEPFTVQDGEVDRAELEVLEPFHAKYEVTGMRRSLDTGDEGIEADFGICRKRAGSQPRGREGQDSPVQRLSQL